MDEDKVLLFDDYNFPFVPAHRKTGSSSPLDRISRIPVISANHLTIVSEVVYLQIRENVIEQSGRWSSTARAEDPWLARETIELYCESRSLT